MKQESTVDLLLDVDQRPSAGKGILLSFQHVFAMFGATILVPLILGMPVSVALFASGVGTLIYMISTGFKVPVYLGSSFAFITAMSLAMKEMGGDVSAAQTGVILTGLVYVLVAASVRFAGTKWIDKLLPPIIIGPMIIVIGLGLAGSAVTNAGLVADGNWKNALVAVVTFLIAAFINTKGKGFLRIIPFLFAIIGGYLFALTLGLVDFTPVLKANWFEIPGFYLPFSTGGAFKEYNLYFGPETIAILPIAIVTISEHIGDHTVLGQICGRQFLKEPGLHRTLLGDGIATSVSAFLGGPANTTYGENTGVIGMTRIASVSVIRNAAFIAIALSFLGKFTALISTIPNAVLGGMSILLYGVIASNGLKVLIKERVDFSQMRNLIIASAMLVLGLGGAILKLGPVTLSGTALSAMTGIILNLILPYENKD
ncbi:MULTISPECIES: uracil-xanthine permease family protein [Streptococcus]|uniref:Uracil permease n=1 Tax=Streptococcus mitis TaxID=28037 RepID=A0A428BHK6_STRMT|nr:MULTISPECIES: solute carrier family 23 protein [Streptococcus]MBZ2105448.1 NCS2 family nucleobase:cation symporter [Streptococcus mitis]MBZ2109008.1 NCS2 family nucleobase:cation symporter [Streptococcus mitis]MBZ8018528.1 NCS2 family nucleobase:cation symporter [Streptococcus pneumoniae]MBZ8049779.1 NCS2 family nucleobase:cation symporter [Streptococcus pneumoniae]MDK7202794.1 solute carrier family 23 protein [Streptococcus sp. UMB1203]